LPQLFLEPHSFTISSHWLKQAVDTGVSSPLAFWLLILMKARTSDLREYCQKCDLATPAKAIESGHDLVPNISDGNVREPTYSTSSLKNYKRFE